MPAIQCVQRKGEKVLITEEEVIKSNKNGMGNDVGKITNYVTSMKEVQSHFPKDSDEYNKLEFRMECGQLFQQAELDKLKGVLTKPMPKYWYKINACGNEEKAKTEKELKDILFLKSLCANKKPYFMIYIYNDLKTKYKTHLKSSSSKCIRELGITLEELMSKENLTDKEKNFIEWYNKLMPVGLGECSMNKICKHIEKEFEGYSLSLKKSSDFDYKVLKVKTKCKDEHREELKKLCNEYVKEISNFKNKKNRNENDDDFVKNRKDLKDKYKKLAIEICKNDKERLNIILELCYEYNNNKQFCWDVVGDLIIKRLEEIKC